MQDSEPLTGWSSADAAEVIDRLEHPGYITMVKAHKAAPLKRQGQTNRAMELHDEVLASDETGFWDAMAKWTVQNL